MFPREIIQRAIQKQEASSPPLVRAGPVINSTRDQYESYVDAKQKANEAFVRAVQSKKLKLLTSMEKYEQLQSILGEDVINLLKEVQELETEHEHGIKSKDIFGFFLTVNPVYQDKDQNEIISTLQKCAKSISKKKGVFSAEWVFEQGGKTREEVGKHPHLHMVLQRNVNSQSGEPSRLKKQLLQIVKRMFPDCQNVNIKVIKDGTQMSRLKYIRGIKNKEYNPELDNQWREINGLKQIYST